MTVTIEFAPQEEAWLDAQSRRQGLSPAEIIKNLIDQQLPPQSETQTAPKGKAPAITAKNAAAIAYLQRRLREEATDDPEEMRKAEEEFQELQRNLNANRDATGERRVFV